MNRIEELKKEIELAKELLDLYTKLKEVSPKSDDLKSKEPYIPQPSPGISPFPYPWTPYYPFYYRYWTSNTSGTELKKDDGNDYIRIKYM